MKSAVNTMILDAKSEGKSVEIKLDCFYARWPYKNPERLSACSRMIKYKTNDAMREIKYPESKHITSVCFSGTS